ncbi:DUF2953 domain-containing protein [Peribacillus cavernae]|uniref:DUF2953 domain-containing protein n=1 Tax=Peribacillus cavernae TaxID=1674310 RepID=A0A433HH27_9BACI|nr:DUF2953 domain-containing protein [Peribacillus cavernae]MDQ0221077.1 hypothetical protein [Peribacillus cavernae]RUQ27628.1 DUF2953 domain-containing protein [Peribacillus cavernae]
MKWLLVIPVLLLALILLLFFTKVKIKIHYHHQQDGDDFYIKFRAWLGILRYTIAVPISKLDDDSQTNVVQTEMGTDEGGKNETTGDVSWGDILTSFEDLNMLIEHIAGFHRISRDFLHKVKVKNFRWHSLAGTGDAVYTGMLTGGCLGIKGSIIGLLSTYLRFKKPPSYSVTPDFGRAVFYTSLTCIFQVRIGEAIWARIKLLRYWNGEKIKYNTGLYNDSDNQSI